jgi:hypothetical protein
MKNISIEYAHIYTNKQISKEQEVSLSVLQKIKENEQNISLVIMVDDYSFPHPSFDYEKFSKWLADAGQAPDIIIRESQLILVCDEVLKFIQNNSLKNDLINYIKDKKYPCSLFIASWYLLRLGKVSIDFFPQELVAEKLINILPKSFMSFEDRAIEIIKATQFSDVVSHIENRYFEGREIV